MPIIGFNFTGIEAKAESEEKRSVTDVNVRSTPNVEDIKKRDLKIPGMKDVLAVEFKFETVYEPQIGSIVIHGEVLYQTDDAKNIISLWKDKKVEQKMATDVLNAIFKKCLTKAVSIADELRLPPPLTFPIVKEGKKE